MSTEPSREARKRWKAAAVLLAAALVSALFMLALRAQRPAGKVSAAPNAERDRGVRGNLSGEAPQETVGPRRRIAGLVLLEGVPASGAVVSLARSYCTDRSCLAAAVKTDSAGRFVLGERPLVEYTVAAALEGASAARVMVDLRDPSAVPAPDQLVLRLTRCRDAVVGTVRDSVGGPLVGARVQLGLEPLDSLATTTGAAGECRLCANREWLEIVASAQGYGALSASLRVYGESRVDFVLLPAGSVEGRVERADDGTPVVAATVQLHSNDLGPQTPASRTARTDAQGKFRFDDVTPGRHYVQAVALGEGLVPSANADVVVEALTATRGVVLRLQPGARVHGRVMAAGEPVAGVHLRANLVGSRKSAQPAVTDAQGQFELLGAPLGNLSFDAYPNTVVAPRTLLVEAADQRVEIEVEPLARVRGTVLYQGKPVPDAVVDTEPGSQRANSDAEGRFEIRGVEAGEYIVTARSADADAQGSSGKVQVGKAQTVDNVSIVLAPTSLIAGIVVDDRGAPRPDAEVLFTRIAAEGERNVSAHGNCRSDGSFAVVVPEPGSYRAEVSVRGRKVAAVDVAGYPVVRLPSPGAQARDIRLVAKVARLRIAGSVVDADGQPRADARVVASPEQSGQTPNFLGFRGLPSALTGLDGAFSIEELQEGRWALRASNADGAEATIRDVEAGRTDVRIVLEASGAIRGSLEGFEGSPEVAIEPSGRLFQTLRPGGARGGIRAARARARGLQRGRSIAEERGHGACGGPVWADGGGNAASPRPRKHPRKRAGASLADPGGERQVPRGAAKRR